VSSYFWAFTNAANSDYTGLPVLKAITSASEEDVHGLTRCWIYGHDGSFPFLFINGGTATISGTGFGAAVIRDAVTQRQVQMLEHTGIRHPLSCNIPNVLARSVRSTCPHNSRCSCAHSDVLADSSPQRPTTSQRKDTALRRQTVVKTLR